MAPRRDGPRPAVIGTCTLRQWGASDPDTLFRDSLSMIDAMAHEAGAQGWALDLAVLPEASFVFVKESVEEVAETLDGPTVTAIAEKARQYHTYATAPVQLRRKGKIYNSIVLLDRQGKVVGVYDKAYPVMMANGTLEHGITPGNAFPVFELDFGRVGAQICWDIAFPDGWQALGDQEVELVIYPTNPACPLMLVGYAWRYNYYIAASTVQPPAVMVAPTGSVLAATSADREVLVRKIDLDFRVLHSNCLWDWQESRAKLYEGRINIAWDPEGYQHLVTSNDPELPVRRFMEQEGLLTGRQRLARNTELQLIARGGPPSRPDLER